MAKRSGKPTWLKKAGINLDLGCGGNIRKQPEWVGLDIRDIEGVDIVHNIETFPWPIPDAVCINVLASHILEHVKPWLFYDPSGKPSVMSEIWRVLKPNGKLLVSAPYGVSPAYIADPTHCNPMNEATFQYFDPRSELFKVYRPACAFESESVRFGHEGFLEVVMRKVVQ